MCNTETAFAQAAMLQEHRHDNDNNAENAKNYRKVLKKEQQLERARSGFLDARFAYGRRNSIRDLVLDRFKGPCPTDDAEMLAELLIPFLVEAASFHKTKDRKVRCPEGEAFRFLPKVIPQWVADHGDMVRALVAKAVADRARAYTEHDPARGKHPRWLPTMSELVSTLRPTREEVRKLRLRGWSCINPATIEEKREADRLRKRAERAAKGATPRSESVSAAKPWEALGVSRRTWYRKRAANEAHGNVTNTSRPYSTAIYGTDKPVPPVANDAGSTPVAA